MWSCPVGSRLPLLEVIWTCWEWCCPVGGRLERLEVVLPCWKWSATILKPGWTLHPRSCKSEKSPSKVLDKMRKVEVQGPSDHAKVRNHLQKCWTKCKNATLFRQSPGNPNAVECGRVSISLYKNAVECGPGTNIDLIY